ncbi:hypothetical protein J7T55_005651 [Diaporthe amygdali]|uniref:uncharacterized protein n=1 Tax=Phomopsis amygdali TaxID=1214568 RepID=UPI0022FE171C|nr:uncharacterized protein J7T55_005651 [Diaporthe amygdali]KAJ0124313.1 hypothetical protein J7T55_005651 [Diaporthe amygdali]
MIPGLCSQQRNSISPLTIMHTNLGTLLTLDSPLSQFCTFLSLVQVMSQHSRASPRLGALALDVFSPVSDLRL